MTSTPTTTANNLNNMVDDYCELLACYDNSIPGTHKAAFTANEMQRIYEKAQDMGIVELFSEAVNARSF